MEWFITLNLDLQADFDNNGSIDYNEFITATLNLNKLEREEKIFAAFSYFDRDGSGYITMEELQQACEDNNIKDVKIEEIIGEIDQNKVMHKPSHLQTS